MLDLLGIGRLWKMLEDVARSEDGGEERTIHNNQYVDNKQLF